jgi:hypothetical protein
VYRFDPARYLRIGSDQHKLFLVRLVGKKRKERLAADSLPQSNPSFLRVRKLTFMGFFVFNNEDNNHCCSSFVWTKVDAPLDGIGSTVVVRYTSRWLRCEISFVCLASSCGRSAAVFLAALEQHNPMHLFRCVFWILKSWIIAGVFYYNYVQCTISSDRRNGPVSASFASQVPGIARHTFQMFDCLVLSYS